ncbi:MAG: pyridoxal phosphate-dependent aminotransferase [Deltaproteobacteria bacterium]|nr:pyridoxal phosphate-dependent aminotransferase [Deltaproteobacteria bacterium]
MLKIANRVKALKSSSIMAISARAAELKSEGHEVISLAAGEPDFNTPELIQAAATKAMKDGITKYTPATGFQSLREAIAKKISVENGFPVDPEEVLITSGAKHGLYLALQCLVDPGEAILIPTPAWVSYSPMIELAGASVIPLPLYEEDGYRPNVERWKGMAIPPNAKGIIINSPNNPTGVVYSREELIKLTGWALQRNLWIISDEIYEKIIYDNLTHTSISALGPEAKKATITVSGFSKSYAMTGWRFGWVIADRPFIAKMASLQSQSNSHVTSFVQWAAITACTLPPEIGNFMVAEFDKRRRYCMDRLDKMGAHLSYSRPTGAFYIFINLSKWLIQKKMTDLEFCKELLNKEYVGVVPGSSFGKEHSIRISYATNIDNLKKAFDRIEAYLNR